MTRDKLRAELEERIREWATTRFRHVDAARAAGYRVAQADVLILLDTPEAAPEPPPDAGVTKEEPVDLFLSAVREELVRARTKFPGDRIMAIACAEEFGELMKALLDEPGSAVWKEAVQTAVMAARVAIDGDGSVDELRRERGLDDHRCGAARLRREEDRE